MLIGLNFFFLVSGFLKVSAQVRFTFMGLFTDSRSPISLFEWKFRAPSSFNLAFLGCFRWIRDPYCLFVKMIRFLEVSLYQACSISPPAFTKGLLIEFTRFLILIEEFLHSSPSSFWVDSSSSKELLILVKSSDPSQLLYSSLSEQFVCLVSWGFWMFWKVKSVLFVWQESGRR